MSTLPFGAPQSRDFALALEIADRERESGRSDVACGMFRVVMAQCPDYAEGWLTFPDVQDKQPVPADFTAMVRVADREQQAARFEEAVALYRVVLAQALAMVLLVAGGLAVRRVRHAQECAIRVRRRWPVQVAGLVRVMAALRGGCPRSSLTSSTNFAALLPNGSERKSVRMLCSPINGLTQ